ncbi:MAG: hypothetical protein WAQ75_07285 [Propionicimonas sp.]
MDKLDPSLQPQPVDSKAADWAGVRWELARSQRSGRVLPGANHGWARRANPRQS